MIKTMVSAGAALFLVFGANAQTQSCLSIDCGSSGTDINAGLSSQQLNELLADYGFTEGFGGRLCGPGDLCGTATYDECLASCERMGDLLDQRCRRMPLTDTVRRALCWAESAEARGKCVSDCGDQFPD